MTKFQNKYRSESLRLQGYNYSSEGVYFITICTQNRLHYFGTISDNKVILSEAGQIVAKEWLLTTKKRDRVVLGEWIVMPNHFHALIGLKPKDQTCKDASHASQYKLFNQRDGFDPSPQKKDIDQVYKNSFGPQRGNISSIIGGFKAACTRQIREAGTKDFNWQSGFYDHIVRNQKSLIKIEDYIKENPFRWQKDRFLQ